MRAALTRAARVLSLLLLTTVAIVAVALLWLWKRQGPDVSGPDGDDEAATIDLDRDGIPTISGRGWTAVIEAQGRATAADRLWQMDLMRRAAGGGLAAWFGAGALPHDRSRRAEDWAGVAERRAAALPADERAWCDAYAAGVNRFIDEAAWAWGVEYVVLRARPEPWTCRDSMLIMLMMGENLSATADDEAAREPLRAALPPAWDAFLFPKDHPWNEPLFGEAPAPLALPPAAATIGGAPPDALDEDAPTPGSNAWAWSGATGTFLANDPHLGITVPQLWYLVRLRVSADDWVVGASIPGLPGVVLGMNPHLAWGFTNTGEDVDDLLIEQLSPDETQYLSRVEDGREIWMPVERRRVSIQVRDAPDDELEVLRTERGPLARRDTLGGAWASRTWLPLIEEAQLASLGTGPVNTAKTWEEMNAALDRFPYPAQNVLIADRAGNLGYRTSGTGVIRVSPDGGRPRAAIEGAWTGLLPAETRPRLLLPASEGDPRFLYNANQRVWVDDGDHRWDGDLRAARLREVLSSRDDFTAEDMEALQLDTTSHFHAALLQWVSARAAPRGPDDEARMARWQAWDGDATSDPRSFTEALAVERAAYARLLGAVRAGLLPPGVRDVPYRWAMRDAWLLVTLGSPGGVARFGLDEGDLADGLLGAADAAGALYPVDNTLRAQHPMADRVPVLGDWLRVPEPEQVGWVDLVRTEQPTFGSSVRLMWDLSDPARSTWITPVGQSGHARSPHYADQQPRWFADERLAVFDPRYDWGLEGR